MATPEQLQALKTIYEQAKQSEHIWPDMAACEAMVETAWLTSELGRDYHNLFGLKYTPETHYLKVTLPTREFLQGKWCEVSARFVWYPGMDGFQACFTDRMHTLERLQDQYPDYRDALHAPDAESYVTAVSHTWSTDPNRAKTCIAVYRAHRDIFNPAPLETA